MLAPKCCENTGDIMQCPKRPPLVNGALWGLFRRLLEPPSSSSLQVFSPPSFLPPPSLNVLKYVETFRNVLEYFQIFWSVLKQIRTTLKYVVQVSSNVLKYVETFRNLLDHSEIFRSVLKQSVFAYIRVFKNVKQKAFEFSSFKFWRFRISKCCFRNLRGRLSPQASWIRRGILHKECIATLRDAGIRNLLCSNTSC